jgi:hypothetical protein
MNIADFNINIWEDSMKKVWLVFICFILAISAGVAMGEDSEMLEVLEEINEKLDKLLPDYERDDFKPYEGGGGGPFLPVMIMFGMGKMNDYLSSIGDFEDYSTLLYPFTNGGGGTCRYSFNKHFQIGMEVYGYGISQYGFLKGGVEIVDPIPSDGFDDYYSYADYGFFVFAFLAQYKVELVKDFVYFNMGGKLGIGGENFTVTRNSRQVTAGAIQALIENTGWSRTLLSTGPYIGMQLDLDKEKHVFKMGLDVGFNYNIPLNTWTPGAGVHKDEAAPPKTFNAMNLWINFGPQFHF